MAREHVDHSDIAQFAADKVNLPKDWADEYRAQAWRLGDKLEKYIADHPDFNLKRIMLSGSLAKGSALKNLNDIDMACYIAGSDAPKDVTALIEYLAEKLRNAFPNFKPEQVQPKTYSVTVSFVGSGLDVDVVPILYDGDSEWYGDLISQDDGTFLRTCIPKHLEFIKSRKSKQPNHFIQVIRLAKFWVKNVKEDKKDFRFKSFMVELVMSKLLDKGVDFSDYPEALQAFFTYLVKTDLKELVAFEDYYKLSAIPSSTDRVRIIDPVNATNNAARLYTTSNAQAIVDAAMDAGDVIDAALAATTKGDTVYYWQKIFGSSFQI